MKRRQLIGGAIAGTAVGVGSIAIWLHGEPSAVRGLPDWASAYRWIDKLRSAGNARSTQGWALPAVLQHLAQSIEFSMDGYPQLQPRWFQASLGRMASSAFQRSGSMDHDLQEPIPGAPALQNDDLNQAFDRLQQVMQRFENHKGELQPHFAYGPMSRHEYQRAHLMHIVDHSRWISTGV